MMLLQSAFDAARSALPVRITGRVASLRGLTLLVDDLPLPAGALVRVGSSRMPLAGEVVGFTPQHAAVMVLGQTAGIRPGDPVTGVSIAATARVGTSLLGRVVDGLGRPLDGKGPLRESIARPLSPEPVPALRRTRITQQLLTGVRALDLMNPVGRGQRLGLFAGPGVGKSTLLGTIARRASSDVNVIALIGERGREVADFMHDVLGEEGLRRSVVIVATGDESPLLRVRAAKLACTVAEFFRDRGRHVLLMMDSVTRFAHAQRLIGLSVGEPPATKGYPPSVFANLALLLERAGAVRGENGEGSITGLYTVLVEGDDMTEPVADASRGILDGHIVLSRKLAHKAHFPAIDVLDSVSRVAGDVTPADLGAARRQITRLIAAHRDVEELVQIGAYAKGSNPESDTALEFIRPINDLLKQGRDEAQPHEQSLRQFLKLASESAAAMNAGTRQRSRAG
ncbi:MAG: FliI/YscN family ATPase [Phycisphaerae bacterium]|nr:FliI/YscN family ATPase [Phycisphaerae bacterium]